MRLAGCLTLILFLMAANSILESLEGSHEAGTLHYHAGHQQQHHQQQQAAYHYYQQHQQQQQQVQQQLDPLRHVYESTDTNSSIFWAY